MKSCIVGIAGGTGSGKSWLAQRLVEIFKDQARLKQTDWYYRDRSHVRGTARLRLNFDHPGAIEVPLLVRNLCALKRGETIEAPQYDYATHRRMKRTVTLAPASLLILDGLFVLHEPSIRKLLDYSIFLDVPADQRLILRIRRDRVTRRIGVEETLRLYETYARPMHERFVQPSRKHAAEIWSSLPTETQIQRLAKKLKRLLSRSH